MQTGANGPQKLPDATAAAKGIARASVAPAVAGTPIFVGDNDPRVPSTGEKAALAGTAGTPGVSNKFVTDTDSRLGGPYSQQAITASVALTGTGDIRANITTVPSGGLDVTLPAANGKAGQRITLCDTIGTEPTTGYLRVLCAGSDKIEGYSQWSFWGPFCSVTLQSDGGTAWTVVDQVGLQGMDPRSIATPWAWFDGGRGITTGAGINPGFQNQVTAWKNMGSGVADLVNGGNSGPVYYAASPVSRPALAFFGPGNLMALNAGSQSWPAATSATIFIVVRRDWSSAVLEALLGFNGAATTGIVCCINPTAGKWNGLTNWVQAGDILWSGNGSNLSQTPQCACRHSFVQVGTAPGTPLTQAPAPNELQVISSTLGPSHDPRIGGAQMMNGPSENVGAIPAISNHMFTVGAEDGSGTNGLTGQIYEVMIFQSTLSTADHLAVAKMLMHKYRERGS